MADEANSSSSSNDREQAPTTAAPATPVVHQTVIQMTPEDLVTAMKAMMGAMRSDSALGTGAGFPINVGATLVSAVKFPIKCLADWCHWALHGDEPGHFGKPPGIKTWPKPATSAPDPDADVSG